MKLSTFHVRRLSRTQTYKYASCCPFFLPQDIPFHHPLSKMQGVQSEVQRFLSPLCIPIPSRKAYDPPLFSKSGFFLITQNPDCCRLRLDICGAGCVYKILSEQQMVLLSLDLPFFGGGVELGLLKFCLKTKYDLRVPQSCGPKAENRDVCCARGRFMSEV
jgi:hypothetical protein